MPALRSPPGRDRGARRDDRARGAEFRLPLLIGLFGFVALQAVIVNKAMSPLVVLTALPARLVAVPFSEVASGWAVVLNLLAGSLLGAWIGATWATKMRSANLYKVLAALLVLIAAALAMSHLGAVRTLDVPPSVRLVAGLVAGGASARVLREGMAAPVTT